MRAARQVHTGGICAIILKISVRPQADLLGGRNSSALLRLPCFEGTDMDPLGLKIILISFLVFVPLERLFALHTEQKVFRRGWANDLIFLFLNGLLIKLG